MVTGNNVNVLNLRCIDNATKADKKNELDVWARLFKARTWERKSHYAQHNSGWL